MGICITFTNGQRKWGNFSILFIVISKNKITNFGIKKIIESK